MAQPDYAGALWWPAHPSNWGYRSGTGVDFVNHPVAWVFHTPEEEADDVASTPLYFQRPGVIASTTYFVSWLGFVFQCVEERWGAYGNALMGKPLPPVFQPGLNVNLQCISVEVEGRRGSIMETINERQWMATVNLVRARSAPYRIPLDRAHLLGHYVLSNQRSDPGPEFMAELVRRLQPEEEEHVRIFVQPDGCDEIYEETAAGLVHVSSPSLFVALGGKWTEVRRLDSTDPVWRLPVYYPDGLPLRMGRR